MTDLPQQSKPVLTGFWPMLIAWAAMLLFALHASTHMVGAGDTWVALACGRHFINHGVDTNEPFSANSHRAGPTPQEIKGWPKWAQSITQKVGLDTVKFWHPTGWVNQNWLTHVIFYWLAYDSPIADGDNWCFNSLVYWKFTIYILTVICVYYTARVLGVHPALAAAFACAAMFIGRSFLDIRPAGFSNLLVALFMLILVLATYRNHLYIWLLVPATIFWSNVHGGYIYVFITLTPVIVLRLLTLLSKRWTVSVYCLLTWLALYMLIVKDTNHEPFTPVSPADDKFLLLLVLLIIASIVLVNWKGVNPAGFYAYHIIVSLFVFFMLLARLFPSNLSKYQITLLSIEYMSNCRHSFFIAFVAAVGLGLIVTLLKNRLVVTSPAVIWHTAFAGLAAFVGSILFNPFHLTNLTHTFVISISEYAEGWRNVHEWWPAFSWDNPVGVALPYMIMIIAGLSVMGLYLAGRLLYPRMLKGPKLELELQQKHFNILLKAIGFAGAVLVWWMVLLSFSFVEANPAGFLLSVLFAGILLASVFANVHFIYLVIPFSFFALWSGTALPGTAGRYIFPFIALPAYCLTFIIGSLLSSKPRFSTVNILYVSAASAVALVICMAALDPFKFKEPIWHLGQFWDLQRIWVPVYEANLEATYKHLFPVIYIINGVCFLSWLITDLVKSLIEQGSQQTGDATGTAEAARFFELPKIDLALITVAVMTVYMGYRSRRFIPIAGYVSCPVIALLVQQFIMTVAAAWNFQRHGRLAAPKMPSRVQYLLTKTAAVVVVGLWVFWGCDFYRIYLAPWPNDPDLTSMFMRMTASHAKPFAACQFISANKMSGNMFNYWTEGGFIAWGQEPDPNTGRTPLQLFMDGRAQAAYNYEAYQRWSGIMFGGEFVRRARERHHTLTPEDYLQIGKWLDEQLKESNVWVVLMPSNVFGEPFEEGIRYSPSWRLVFLDDKQKIYVDITKARGAEIFQGIRSGQTKYPSEALRNIMLAHNVLVSGRGPEEFTFGLECAVRSFVQNPSRISLEIIRMFYDNYPQFKPQIDEFWKKYLDDFMANEKKYLGSDNYFNRALGAYMAMNYLQPRLVQENNEELIKVYKQEGAMLRKIMDDSRFMKW